jgi:YD repeat-containing protein
LISQIRNRKNKQKKEPVNAIISANDNGGTISYTYYPDGKVKTITSPGGAVTSMQYDIAGNQTQLNDPSAGTINYTYDGFGQLLTQTNARSQQTTMSYLPDGRINSKTTPEGTYSYTYNTNKQLSGVTSPSSISRGGTTILNMAYSNNGNITTKSDIGTSFEYSNSSRPYAITNVSTSSGIIPLTTQTITYNSFEKINSITEGQFNANFVYNSDNERCKMEMLQNGTSVLTRWYI